MIRWAPRVVAAVAAVAGAVAVALAAAPATARADDDRGDDVHDPWRPGLLPPGAVQLGLGGWARRADRAVGVMPELWLGVGRRLTLGLSHAPGSDGLAAPPRGACVHACPTRYRGALIAHVDLGAGDRVLGQAALVIDAVAPTAVAIELGVVARWRQGRTWARVEPALRLGVYGRALANRERAGVGLAVGVDLTAAVTLGAAVTPRGPADEHFFAGLVLPTRVELAARLPAAFTVGVAAGTDDSLAVGGGHALAALLVSWRR